MLIASSLLNLRELYRQEMKAKARDFAYEDVNQRKKFKAIV